MSAAPEQRGPVTLGALGERRNWASGARGPCQEAMLHTSCPSPRDADASLLHTSVCVTGVGEGGATRQRPPPSRVPCRVWDGCRWPRVSPCATRGCRMRWPSVAQRVPSWVEARPPGAAPAPSRTTSGGRRMASLAQGFALCRRALAHVLAQRGPGRSSQAEAGPPGGVRRPRGYPSTRGGVWLAQGLALCRKGLSCVLAQRGPGRSLLVEARSPSPTGRSPVVTRAGAVTATGAGNRPVRRH
jgi:hypothetical protein